MQFEFNHQLMPQNLIEIDEIGQFGLEAWNGEGFYWYLIVRTCLGTATIATCGPIIPDIELLPSGFKMTLDKMPYKEDKLAKNISYFLNDRTKCITDAKTTLGKITTSSNNIVDQLIQLQELVHDTEGSNITEDYKDYAVLFGEDGIKHFVDTLDSLLVDAEDTLNVFKVFFYRRLVCPS